MTYSEEELLQGIIKGDAATLRFLYREYYGPVAHYILKNQGSEQEARDVFQDAIVLLYDKLKKGTLTLSCKAGTYLHAVCRKMWLKRLVVLGRFGGKLMEDKDYEQEAEEDTEAFSEQDEQLKRMSLCMSKLGEPCNTLLTDYYFHKLNMEAITEKFGYTNADNAKNQKYKCMQRLKKYFFDKA